MGISRSGISRLGISRDGISRGGVSNIHIPANALVYYNYGLASPILAITEQVGKTDQLSTTRASNSNPIQLDGSVTTVGTNTAALVTGDGVLIQGESDNEIIQSSAYDVAAWLPLGVVNTDNALSFNGYNFSNTKVDTSTGTHRFHVTCVLSSITESTQYHIVKKSTARYIFVSAWRGGADRYGAIYDLDTLTVTATTQAGTLTDIFTEAVDLGGGVILLSMTVKFASSFSYYAMLGLSEVASPTFDGSGFFGFTGDGSLDVYVAHTQVEKSLFRSSPIYTTGSAATRAADDSTISTDDFLETDFIIEGSFVYRGTNGAFPRVFSSGPSEFGDNILLEFTKSINRLTFVNRSPPLDVILGDIPLVEGTTYNFAIEMDSVNGCTISANGSTSSTNASFTSVSWNASTLRLLRGINSGANDNNGVFKTFTMKPL